MRAALQQWARHQTEAKPVSHQAQLQLGAKDFQIDPQRQPLVRQGALQPRAETTAIWVEDPAILINVRQFARALGQLCLGANHHQFHLADRLADDVVREDLPSREQRRSRIQLTAFDFAHQLTAPPRGHLCTQVGVLDAQMFECIKQHHITNGLRHTQAQQPGGRCISGDQFTQGIHLAQDHPALFIHPRASRRRLERLGVAVEQLHTQGLLKVLHSPRNRWLSQLQGLSGMADGLTANHFDEGVDIINFHLVCT
ncbi:hypothetical protein D3C73_1040620 [compost metagenome]